MRWSCLIITLILLSGTSPAFSQAVPTQASGQRFDHWQHRRLFPSCTSCHAGAIDREAGLFPAASACADCHDGKVEKRVEWQPPADLPPTNLRFTHQAHANAVRRATTPDSTVDCATCHAPGGERMRVRLAVAQTCLDCHGIRAAHLSTPDTSCATCHVTLARATRLTRRDIADFPVPASHRQPRFVSELHGQLARNDREKYGVSAACATCHARDFCAECHVNAPEVPVIQALAADPRSTAQEVELEAPASHADPDFLHKHGRQAHKAPGKCATCHTQESCLTCHLGRTAAVSTLAVAGPGRAAGAVVRRRRPASHGPDFSDNHGPVADARPQSCEGCHVRPQCLDCHRPNAADATPGYHPAGFLSRHPASAYSRETDCGDCHNSGQFCADCHVKAGLSARGQLDAGYHDAKQFFLLGHGQAARQNLESCVACHAERDCLTCHSALTGRRFNPHGPGFDPATLRRKNSQVCTACHGALIPEAP